jgi:hypothetical protein
MLESCPGRRSRLLGRHVVLGCVGEPGTGRVARPPAPPGGCCRSTYPARAVAHAHVVVAPARGAVHVEDVGTVGGIGGMLRPWSSFVLVSTRVSPGDRLGSAPAAGRLPGVLDRRVSGERVVEPGRVKVPSRGRAMGANVVPVATTTGADQLPPTRLVYRASSPSRGREQNVRDVRRIESQRDLSAAGPAGPEFVCAPVAIVARGPSGRWVERSGSRGCRCCRRCRRGGWCRPRPGGCRG